MTLRSRAVSAAVAFVGLMVAASCTAPPAPVELALRTSLSADDVAAIRTALATTERNLSPEDNAAWAAGYTEDAIFMFEGNPTIRGREAIQTWGEGDSGVALSVSFADIEIQGTGDWAWGTSTWLGTFEGASDPVHGKQLLIMARQAHGSRPRPSHRGTREPAGVSR